MKNLLIALIDLLIIYLCILFSYSLLEDYLLSYETNKQAFQVIAPFVGVWYIIVMYAYGLYDTSRRRIGDVIYSVFLASVAVWIGIMAIAFFVRGDATAFPRSVILLSALFYWIVLTLWRCLVWKLVRWHYRQKTVLTVGDKADKLTAVIADKLKHIYQVKYTCDENYPDLLPAIEDSDVIFMSSGISAEGREKILLAAMIHEKDIYFIPEYQDVLLMSSTLQKTDDIPTCYLPKMGFSVEERFVKRLFDLILGSIGLVIALPVGIITAVLVKLDGGPVFYSQERLTLDGKIFKILKFRSMIPAAEKTSGPVNSSKKDTRITKVGHFLRATRLDEMPQIINILFGNMSIVGPRPERPFFVEQYEKECPQYRQRLKVKAGLTGLAQVEGKYNTTFENKLRYDLLYINNYSLFQDLLIIMKTIKILFMKESTEGYETSR